MRLVPCKYSLKIFLLNADGTPGLKSLKTGVLLAGAKMIEQIKNQMERALNKLITQHRIIFSGSASQPIPIAGNGNRQVYPIIARSNR